jgi:tetratricopeptide (TPR) repeat protein
VIDVAPSLLPDFQAAVAAFIDGWPLPLSREKEVRLARLKARALHAQGKPEDALEACEDARYSLNARGTGSDDFIEHELPWLLETGKIEAAGERAFTAIYEVQCLENGLEESVYRTILERLADPADASVWWPLCVMRACVFFSTVRELLAFVPDEASPVHRALFGNFLDADPETITEETDLDPIFQAARELAEKRAPGHVWIRRLAAVQDFSADKIDAPAYLREIDAVVASGLGDRRTIQALYEARVSALGVMETLKFPFPVFPCGVWAYHGAAIPEDLREKAWDTVDETGQEAMQRWDADFQRATYEQGRACMERYFETGKGHPFDASAHLYSMLCNNLAIRYRFDGRPEEALELHRRGIEASSFAEHYDGILWCQIEQKDKEGIIKAAEDLWHYSAEYGYSRHTPDEYVEAVADSLYALDRDGEIPVWLERLVTFQREEQRLDENHLPDDALIARLKVAYDLHHACPDQGLAIWEALKPQVDASSSPHVFGSAGDLLWGHKRHAEAVAYYERRLALKPSDLLAKRVAEYYEELKVKEKHWWQVWK